MIIRFHPNQEYYPSLSPTTTQFTFLSESKRYILFYEWATDLSDDDNEYHFSSPVTKVLPTFVCLFCLFYKQTVKYTCILKTGSTYIQHLPIYLLSSLSWMSAGMAWRKICRLLWIDVCIDKILFLCLTSKAASHQSKRYFWFEKH